MLHRLAANPYFANAALLLVLASPLPVAKLTLDVCIKMAKAVPGLLSSGKAWRKCEEPALAFLASVPAF
jgi:hypothetical protein